MIIEEKPRRTISLLEFLVVVAILSALLAWAGIALNRALKSERDVTRLADVHTLRNNLDRYYLDHYRYPSAPEKLVLGVDEVLCLGDNGWGKAPGKENGQCGEVVYLPRVPAAPSTPAGNVYQYTALTTDGAVCSNDNCSDYKLTYTLEVGTSAVSAGSHTATPKALQ